MTRDVLIYSILLVLSLGLAYQSSLPRSANESEVVRWVDIKADAIESVEYQAPKLSIKATRNGKRFWIDYNATLDEGKPAEVESFLASKEFNEVIQSFSPLEALRVIGKVDEKSLADFGLDATAGRLVIHHGGGQQFVLKVGSKPYSSANRFLLDEAKNSVLLVAGRHLEKLERARNRLYEREISDLKWDELTKATIAVGERVKELERTKKGDDGVVGWSTLETDSKPKAIFQNWFGKVDKLKVTNFASPEEAKMVELSTPFLVLSLATKDGAKDQLEFRKSDNNGVISYWIKTNYLGAFAKLNNSRMDTIEKDLAPIMDEN
jgi:hypothetical protein